MCFSSGHWFPTDVVFPCLGRLRDSWTHRPKGPTCWTTSERTRHHEVKQSTHPHEITLRNKDMRHLQKENEYMTECNYLSFAHSKIQCACALIETGSCSHDNSQPRRFSRLVFECHLTSTHQEFGLNHGADRRMIFAEVPVLLVYEQETLKTICKPSRTSLSYSCKASE